MIISTAYFLISIALSAGLNLGIYRDTVANNTIVTNGTEVVTETPAVGTTTVSNSSDVIIDTTTPEYLIRISSQIDDFKVPAYLSNLILTEPSAHNITSDDILTLYGLKTINLNEFKNILNILNISSASVFSLNGFESVLMELQLNFNEVYANIIKELGVDPAQQLSFLQAVGVDMMSFSFSLQFGDSFVEFKNGNFTNDVFQNALKDVNRTTAQVFNSCRVQFVNGILSKSPEETINILQKYGVDRSKSAFLLKTLGFEASKLQEITAFDNLLHKFLLEIDNQSPLGILIRYNQVIINKGIADLFQITPIKMTVQHLNNSATYPVSVIQNSTMPDFMVLALNKTSLPTDPKTYATLASTNNSLQNCVFFSVDANKESVSEIVSVVENFGSFLKFNSTIFSTNISMGSPLVCSNNVYGLAKEISAGVVTLNAFPGDHGNSENGTIFIDEIHVPSASKMMLGNSLFVFLFSLLGYLTI